MWLARLPRGRFPRDYRGVSTHVLVRNEGQTLRFARGIQQTWLALREVFGKSAIPFFKILGLRPCSGPLVRMFRAIRICIGTGLGLWPIPGPLFANGWGISPPRFSKLVFVPSSAPISRMFRGVRHSASHKFHFARGIPKNPRPLAENARFARGVRQNGPQMGSPNRWADFPEMPLPQKRRVQPLAQERWRYLLASGGEGARQKVCFARGVPKCARQCV